MCWCLDDLGALRQASALHSFAAGAPHFRAEWWWQGVSKVNILLSQSPLQKSGSIPCFSCLQLADNTFFCCIYIYSLYKHGKHTSGCASNIIRLSVYSHMHDIHWYPAWYPWFEFDGIPSHHRATHHRGHGQHGQVPALPPLPRSSSRGEPFRGHEWREAREAPKAREVPSAPPPKEAAVAPIFDPSMTIHPWSSKWFKMFNDFLRWLSWYCHDYPWDYPWDSMGLLPYLPS